MKGIMTAFSAIALFGLMFSPVNAAGTASDAKLYREIEFDRQDNLLVKQVPTTTSLHGPIGQERQVTLLEE